MDKSPAGRAMSVVCAATLLLILGCRISYSQNQPTASMTEDQETVTNGKVVKRVTVRSTTIHGRMDTIRTVTENGKTTITHTIKANGKIIFSHTTRNGESLGSTSDQPVQHQINRSISATSIQTLQVHSNAGAITVVPATTGQISITATITLEAAIPDTAHILSRFTIPATVSGGTLDARVVPPKDLPSEASWRVTYRISVPPTIQLDLGTQNGAIAVHDVGTSIRAQTRSGAITIQGATRARTVSAHASYGAVSLEGATGAVDLGARSGAIHCSGKPTSVVLISSYGRIDMTLTNCSALTNASLQARAGAISVAVPASASLAITGETRQGKITAHGFSTQSIGEYGRHSLTATLNGGKVPMHLSTDYGNITIRTR